MGKDKVKKIPQENIMVVEDNASDLKFLSNTLKKAGYQVRPAGDGELALRSVKAKLPDLILLDISLPGMNGIEVCRCLKDDSETRGVPVIFISALGDVDLKVAAFEAGGVDYITKPLNPAEILARIKTHVNIYLLQRELADRSEKLAVEVETRRQTEEELRLQSTITSNLAEGVYLVKLDDGIIVYANPRFEKMCGYGPDEMTGQHISIVNAPGDKDPEETASEIINALLKNGEWYGELNNIKKDGTAFWCYANVSVFEHSLYGKVCVAVHTDITERKLAVELRDRLMEHSPTTIYIFDELRNFVDANPAGERLLGYSRDELLTMCIPHVDAAPDRVKPAHEQLDLREPLINFEHQLRHKDGRIITVLNNSIALQDASSKKIHWYSFLIDITERKQAEEQLERLTEHLQITARKVITAQEEERRNIAHELHDEIGQALTVLMINLQNMQNLPEAPAIQTILRDSLDVAEKTIQQVREMSLNLRPPMLDDLGLVPAIRWHIDRQAQRGGFAGHLVSDNIKGPYSAELEITVYRVVQEGLTNVLRHAHARNVEVELTEQDGRFVLWLRDDGDGFDASSITKNHRPDHGLGLAGMEERILLLDGQFQIKSTPGQGAELYACIPLEPVTAMQRVPG